VTGTASELKSALRGETLRVELFEPSADAVRAALAGVPALRDVVVEATGTSGAIVARTDDASAALPRVIGALGAAGVAFGAASVSGPTLDDVYLHHVGHSFGTDATTADPTTTTSTTLEGEAA
jgi:ABC-2 type transport system ATP-binding protein